MGRPPTESEILLGLLLIGDSQPGEIAEEFGRHPGSISRSITKLVEDRLIVEKGRSTYALTCNGYSAARGVLKRRVKWIHSQTRPLHQNHESKRERPEQ